MAYVIIQFKFAENMTEKLHRINKYKVLIAGAEFGQWRVDACNSDAYVQCEGRCQNNPKRGGEQKQNK